MKYKHGDIIVWEEYSNLLYLVLEVNPEKEQYTIFILAHPHKDDVGLKETREFSYLSSPHGHMRNSNLKDVNLKDMKLNET